MCCKSPNPNDGEIVETIYVSVIFSLSIYLLLSPWQRSFRALKEHEQIQKKNRIRNGDYIGSTIKIDGKKMEGCWPGANVNSNG